jgi:arsenate reductase
VEDPAKATGSDADIDAQFEQAYRTLRARIEAFLKLPMDRLWQDREQFQIELHNIAKQP